MGAFEYLSVLISIILALGMTRVLGGVGEMLQARSQHRIYWVHVIWIVNLFPVPRDRLVDLLPLARSTAVDILPFSFRPDLPNNFVFWRHSYCFHGKAMLTLLSITRRTITRIIVPFSFSSHSLYQSILLTRY